MFAIDVRGRVVDALLEDGDLLPSYRHVGAGHLHLASLLSSPYLVGLSCVGDGISRWFVASYGFYLAVGFYIFV